MANKLKQKRERRMVESILAVEADEQTATDSVTDIKSAADARQGWWFGLHRNGRLLVLGMTLFIVVGVFGAGFKYLEDDAKRQQADSKTLAADLKNKSWVNRINPFVSAPLPTSTPQLSKEYIYAGSRLLTVEDANANAAPPADLAVWRASSGVWYVMGGPGSQQTFTQFGTDGDIALPGDFDGDGKTDFSTWRPSNRFWYVFNSSSGSWYGFNYGRAGDQPIVADFDGDGKSDFTVFRASNRTWYVNRSTDLSNFYPQEFGLSGDIPAPADYDGDGRADHAVWQPNSQIFVVLRSSDGLIVGGQLGVAASGTPVCADYDGDGLADFAIKSGNTWIIKHSSTNQTQSITWEQAGDIPVPNDYDGDGKVDIAVWRDSNGIWFIRNSSTGNPRQEQWGLSGDIPVPAFYRR